jgi:hypothetical protein
MTSPYDKVKMYFHLSIQEASICLGMTPEELRMIVRENGHTRWPFTRTIPKIARGMKEPIQHFYKLTHHNITPTKIVPFYPKSSKIFKDVATDIIAQLNLEQFERMHKRFISSQRDNK